MYNIVITLYASSYSKLQMCKYFYFHIIPIEILKDTFSELFKLVEVTDSKVTNIMQTVYVLSNAVNHIV
jgi:hypothetical protein